MIRALALILGLLLGLVLAGATGGTVAHLRMLAGERLPGWVAGLDAGSRLVEGSGTLNGAALHWRRQGLGLALDLRGPDWQARGRGQLEGAALRIDDLSGIVPLDWLGAGGGVLALEAGEVLLGPDGSLRAARIDGQARGGQLEGPVTLVWDDGWALSSR